MSNIKIKFGMFDINYALFSEFFRTAMIIKISYIVYVFSIVIILNP